jgi:pyridinium-3,5-biscarboxylic acid mononucleotide synthase
MTQKQVVFDVDREDRIGLPEAVFCEGKSLDQIISIVRGAEDRSDRVFLTRLGSEPAHQITESFSAMDYDPVSRTAILGAFRDDFPAPRVAVISGGSSDVPVAQEAIRTLSFHGQAATPIFDIGVAGLWRLQERLNEIVSHDVVIVAAGMDAALVSVLGGLVRSSIIALPTSTGYGVANKGMAALNASLTSCAPGIVVTNIDNGYGAGCAALRVLNAIERHR